MARTAEGAVLFEFNDVPVENARAFCKTLVRTYPRDRLVGFALFFCTGTRRPGVLVYLTFEFSKVMCTQDESDATQLLESLIGQHKGKPIAPGKVRETLKLFQTPVDVQACICDRKDVDEAFNMATQKMAAVREVSR